MTKLQTVLLAMIALFLGVIVLKETTSPAIAASSNDPINRVMDCGKYSDDVCALNVRIIAATARR